MVIAVPRTAFQNSLQRIQRILKHKLDIYTHPIPQSGSLGLGNKQGLNLCYRSSDSGISKGSRETVGKMRDVPSEIHPWAVLLKVGRLAVGSWSSGNRGAFKSTSGSLKVIPRGAFSKPPNGVATLRNRDLITDTSVLVSVLLLELWTVPLSFLHICLYTHTHTHIYIYIYIYI